MSRFLILLACLSLSSSPLLAADARALFQAGSTALAAGKADEAVTNFEAAYAAQPSPALLYWLGEAHRTAGHPAKAAGYYRRYLKTAPRGAKRADAKARLAELKKAAAPGKRKKTRRMRAAEMDLAGRPPQPELQLPGATPPAPPLDLPPPPLDLLLPGQEASAPQAAAPSVNVAPPVAPPPAPPAAVVEPSPPAVQAAPPPAPPALAAAPPTSSPAAARDVIAADSGDFYYVSYTARLLAPNGSRMLNYATTASPGDGTLYTHGFAFGRQTDHFKNAIYVGFGTEFGGGPDTLLRYEISWQMLYTPFGFDPIGRTSRASTKLISPHLGFRIGGMGVDSQTLTGGTLKPGVVLAAQAGIDLQVFRWLVLTPGMGYDLNLGPDLGPNASVSGYSFDLSGTLRY